MTGYWDSYLELKPDNGKAYLERGGAYLHAGKRELALEDARKACKLGVKKGCEVVGRYSEPV